MVKRFITSIVIFAAGFALCAFIHGKNPVSLAKEKLSPPLAGAAQAQKEPQPKIVWEYTSTNNPNDLNKLGAQGWELVGVSDLVTESGTYASSSAYFYFKRAK
jgi:hypothetical protein